MNSTIEKIAHKAGTMQLTPEEQAMLRGDMGPAVQEAIRFQIEVGGFFDARRFVPITHAHVRTNLISNSGKLVNTITAHRFNTVLRRTRDCVEIACTGRLA